jgi:hypothetical protein
LYQSWRKEDARASVGGAGVAVGGSNSLASTSNSSGMKGLGRGRCSPSVCAAAWEQGSEWAGVKGRSNRVSAERLGRCAGAPSQQGMVRDMRTCLVFPEMKASPRNGLVTRAPSRARTRGHTTSPVHAPITDRTTQRELWAQSVLRIRPCDLPSADLIVLCFICVHLLLHGVRLSSIRTNLPFCWLSPRSP